MNARNHFKGIPSLLEGGIVYLMEHESDHQVPMDGLTPQSTLRGEGAFGTREITPEMIDAGVIALEACRNVCCDSVLVAQVYTAMRLCGRCSSSR